MIIHFLVACIPFFVLNGVILTREAVICDERIAV